MKVYPVGVRFRRTIFCLMLAAFALLTTVPVLAQNHPVRWLNRLNDATAARNSSQKPQLIYFYNTVARPCAVMKKETLDNTAIQRRLQDFVCVSINTQSDPNAAQQYGIFKVPTVVMLDAKGKEVDRAIGYKNQYEFSRYLDRVRIAAAEDSTGNSSGGLGASILPFKNSAVDITVPTDGTYPITLTLNAPTAKRVEVRGDFNDWRDGATPMRKISSGEWVVTIYLIEGVYEYLFHIDDGNWQPDARNPLKKVNNYNTYNSIIVVGSQKTSPIIKGNDVYFILYRPEAKNISVAGSFNNWEILTMFRNPKDPAMWGAQYTLPPGDYVYKYVIDEEWTNDPENYWPVDDGSGHINSSFSVR